MRKVLLGFCFLFILSACVQKVPVPDIEGKPSFVGIVKEVSSSSILVKVNSNEIEMRSSDVISVSLDFILDGEVPGLHVNDRVRVFYDGLIAESYPAQINGVYGITKLR